MQAHRKKLKHNIKTNLWASSRRKNIQKSLVYVFLSPGPYRSVSMLFNNECLPKKRRNSNDEMKFIHRQQIFLSAKRASILYLEEILLFQHLIDFELYNPRRRKFLFHPPSVQSDGGRRAAQNLIFAEIPRRERRRFQNSDIVVKVFAGRPLFFIFLCPFSVATARGIGN